jgi:hypothetical protein
MIKIKFKDTNNYIEYHKTLVIKRIPYLRDLLEVCGNGLGGEEINLTDIYKEAFDFFLKQEKDIPSLNKKQLCRILKARHFLQLEEDNLYEDLRLEFIRKVSPDFLETKEEMEEIVQELLNDD